MQINSFNRNVLFENFKIIRIVFLLKKSMHTIKYALIVDRKWTRFLLIIILCLKCIINLLFWIQYYKRKKIIVLR